MRRNASLFSLLAVGVLALSACSTTGSTAPSTLLGSASAADTSVAASTSAPAAEATTTVGADAPTAATTSSASAAVGLPSGVLAKAPGLANKVNGWLTGFSQAGCEGMDLSSQGRARGCLNQVKGAAGVTQGVSEALRHAGDVPADSPLGTALTAATDLRSQWMAASCMRDVTAGECVSLAQQFPPALRTLGDALSAAK